MKEREAEAKQTPDRRRFALLLGLVVVAGFALRLLYALSRGDFQPITDPNYYHLQANLIADGYGFIDPFTWLLQGKEVATAAHPPLFTLVLSVASVLGADTVLWHRVVGCLIGAGAVAAIGLLGRRVGGPAVGLTAAGIAALYPNLWVFDAGVFAESLELLLVPLLLLCVYRFRAKPRWREVVALGVLTALLTLTRSELALFVPFLVLPAILGRRSLSWGRRWLMAGAACVVVVAILAPWLVRNATTFSEPVAMSTNGDLFVGYTNCDATYSGVLFAWWDAACAPSSVFADRATDEAARMVAARERGVEYARGNVPRLLGVVIWGRAARLWNVYRPVQTAELQVVEDRPKSVSLLGTAAFFALVPLAIVGLVHLRRRRRPAVWPLLVPVAIGTVTAMAFAGNVRFRAVAEPSIVVLAAVGVVWLVKQLRARSAGPPVA